MAFNVAGGRNPQWVDAEHTLITLEVRFNDDSGEPMFDGDWLPFTASPDDVEEHGRLVFEMAARGDFGAVAAYVPPTLDWQKQEKLAQLGAWFNAASANAHLTSSLGFEIDADEVANRNIEGLLVAVQAGQVSEPVYFMDYTNQVHPVTLADLETMRLEVIANGQALYQQKWALRNAIEAAQTQEELDVIVIPTL